MEQGEPIGKIESTDADDYSTQYWGELDMKAFDDGKWKVGDNLYIKPQQPQSVADALEEAAKICEGYERHYSDIAEIAEDASVQLPCLDKSYMAKECSEAIRALIKRNAEGVE